MAHTFHNVPVFDVIIFTQLPTCVYGVVVVDVPYQMLLLVDDPAVFGSPTA
jgi:hypothetical protein